MAIYNENGVPLLLNLSPSAQEYVEGKHRKAVEALEAHAKAVHAKRAPLKAGEDPTPEAVAQAEDISKHLLLGEAVLVHNKVPIGGSVIMNPDGTVIASPDGPQYTPFSIGASTLQEALTEVIGAFDTVHLQTSDHIDPPDWVASTNKDLARLLAEHWDAEVRDIAEVLGG